MHGEDLVCRAFAQYLAKELGILVTAPFSGSIYDLAQGVWLKETQGIPISKEVLSRKRAQGVYLRLWSAGERLLSVIKENKDGANKDLAKFADQINSLCDKWTR